jgi:predicted ATPase
MRDDVPVLRTLAISNYRSLRELVVPLGSLTVVTGPNGSGKSNLYRALRLLQDTATGGAIASLAREGGLPSVLWAGPEQFSQAVRRRERKVEGTRRKKPVALRIGFCDNDFGYSIEFGLPSPAQTAFRFDPEIKREAIWTGEQFRAPAAIMDRHAGLVRGRSASGTWEDVALMMPAHDSILSGLADPHRGPVALILRERLRSWRFYDSFRTDPDAPARQLQIGTRTPLLSHDGRDVAAALQTIRETGHDRELDKAVSDAFPGAHLQVSTAGGFGLEFRQEGLLRSLSQAELSDGTLRYILWIAALLTPRLPALMVLNEPEASLHPELLPALGRLIRSASERCQIWVTTHSAAIRKELERSPRCQSIVLEKDLGETSVVGQTHTSRPPWSWPSR